MTRTTLIIFLGLMSQVFLYQPLFGQNLSGIYTIGNVMGSEDYSTLSAAIADLKAGTITGDVEYQIAIGTYNETVDLSSINNGAFTITFSGANQALTIVHPLDGIGVDESGILIENTNHVILKNFTLEMDDIADAPADFEFNETRGINVSGASDITFENLILSNADNVFSESYNVDIASAVSLNNVEDISITSSNISGAGILIYLDDFQRVSISNNDFSDGQNHIYNFQEADTDANTLIIDGNSFTGPFPTGRKAGALRLEGHTPNLLSPSFSANLMIENNTIDAKVSGSDDTIYGIYLNVQRDPIIRNNFIEDGSTGLYVAGSTNALVESNQVYRSTNSGLHMHQSFPSNVVNNVFTSTYRAGTMFFSGNARIAHNTFHTSGTLSALRIQFPSGDSLTVLNNILMVENTSSVELTLLDITSSDITIDHNLYSGNANTHTIAAFNLGGSSGLSYNATSLSDWQANQALYDQNSQSFVPTFAGVDDYHITDATNYRFGTTIEGITTDIDGDYRDPLLGMDVGADQYCNPACVAPVNPPTIAAFSPASGPIGTHVTVFGSDFDEVPTNNTVYFGASQGTVVAASENELIVEVPYGATREPITVFTNQLAAQSLTPFHVTFESDGKLDYTSFDDQTQSFVVGADPRNAAVGDLDNDGLVDVVSLSAADQTLSILRNTSSGIGEINFATKVDHALAGGPREILLEDFNGDGYLDIVVSYFGTAVFSIFENTTSSSPGGNMTFGTRQDISTTTDSGSIASTDINADGQTDIIVAENGADQLIIFENTSDLGSSISFANNSTLVTGDAPRSVAVDDIDQDGKPDVIVGSSNDATISIFLKDGTSFGFAARQDFPVGNDAVNIVTGDIDGDNVPDIVMSIDSDVIINYSDRVRFMRNNSTPGTLTFTSSEAITGVDWVDLDDLNGDGFLDAVLMERHVGMGFKKNTSSSGTFGFDPDDGFAQDVESIFIITGDLDNDGEPDLIMPGFTLGGSFVEISRNLSGRHDFTSFSMDEQSGAATIDVENHTISISVVDCTVPTNLIPDFGLSPGASAQVAAVPQQSGVTANDYSSPLQYVVTAEDGSTQNWTVTVNAARLPDNVVENITACESYEFDGATLTTSGQYNAMFTNIHGCDSLVTLNLTINESDNEVENITACDSYEFDGAMLTTTGQYNALFTNQVGCDSLVTLNLTINVSENVIENVTACDSYEFDGATLTTTGQYNALFTNQVGCDSLVTLNLTIHDSDNVVENVTTCDSYEFDGATLTTTGQYNALFTNQLGCDSLVTLNLTINVSDNVMENVTTCESYAFDGATLTTSGQYNAMFTNLHGCDSLVTLNLTIHESNEVDEVLDHCGDYQFGSQLLTSSGIYVETFENQAGCDSTVTLTFGYLPIPAAEIEANGVVLFANELESATYQWYDCDTNQPIEGEDKRQLTPPRTGNYYVEVTSGGCSTISDCMFFDWVLSTKEQLSSQAQLYPTISNGHFTLDLGSTVEDVDVRIWSLDGRVISANHFDSFFKGQLEIEGIAGTYLVQVWAEGQIIKTQKIFKK